MLTIRQLHLPEVAEIRRMQGYAAAEQVMAEEIVAGGQYPVDVLGALGIAKTHIEAKPDGEGGLALINREFLRDPAFVGALLEGIMQISALEVQRV